MTSAEEKLAKMLTKANIEDTRYAIKKMRCYFFSIFVFSILLGVGFGYIIFS